MARYCSVLIFQELKMRLFAFACVLFSVSVSAQWQLNSQESSLNFISTKNTHFSEVHSFDRLNGEISEKGDLSISIDLTSVNTLIEIRNTRMQEMLFNVAEFATAEFTASIPMETLNSDVGSSITLDINGTLSLHGAKVPVTASVKVMRLTANDVVASTTKPIVLNANQFGLEPGVAALQKIAGLSNISLAVPVTFAVHFTQ
jgi:polyisoprenoid-binding protein YceI